MIFEVDGRTVFAATGGQPVRTDRPVAVFLHGAGMDHSVWTLPGRYVAHHGGTALALDLPGHGKSDGPALGSIAEMAAWVWRVLDAQKIARAFFVGHSMGALIGLEAARTRPERVAGLMLVGFAPRMPVHPDLLEAAKRNDPKAAALIASWGFGPAGQVGGNQTPGLAMLPLGLRLIERAAAGTLYADLAACDAYRDAGTEIACPVLLLQGTADRMTPAKGAKAFVEKLPKTDIRMLDGIGHMVMAEAPDDVTAALRDFIR
ncbi:alpha/beta fold hydrolase [Dongia sedimenti]|uniref:Alpha/beta fold hydrolase n=1 Tax=Dongia sedimenti TaxID=3064282 RepID=A0ABU0YK64_9PROT|nr:alpha/beta fold hydrolase [Rhodospirillaceae bacterium R-7]